MYKPETDKLFKSHAVTKPTDEKMQELIQEAQGYDWCKSLHLRKEAWVHLNHSGYLKSRPFNATDTEHEIFVPSLILYTGLHVIPEREWIIIMGFDSHDKRPNINMFWEQLQNLDDNSDMTMLEAVIRYGLGMNNPPIINAARLMIYG